MRILQIIQRPQLRGAEIFACQLAEQLVAKGHKVDVMILFGAEPQTLPFNLKFYFLHAIEKKRWWDVAAYRRLAKFISEHQYDIVQANAADTLKYAALSRALFSWPGKLVFRNANKISDFLHSNLKRILNKWLLGQVDFVASVSEECRSDFQELFGFRTDRIQTLPIGVNMNAQFLDNPFLNTGVDTNAPILLCVAGFVKEKNHTGLLRIFRGVHEKNPAAQLVLVGEGKLRESIEKTCEELGLSHAVFFLGKRNDVPALMQHSSLLVLPSLIEGLPGVILEAFSNELPVIANNVGGVSEVIKHRETGWLVPVIDEEQFTHCVQEALHMNGAELKGIKANAWELVTKEYNNVVIAERFLKTYTALLNDAKSNTN